MISDLEAVEVATDLASTIARAQGLATDRGYTRRMRERPPEPGLFSLCKPDHPRWAPRHDLGLVRCGLCHPPAPGLDVVWIERAQP